MIIRLKEIKDEGLSLDFEEEATTFSALSELSKSEDIEFLAPVRTQVRALQANGIVEVAGTSQTRVRVSCSRCLTMFDMSVQADYDLAFTHGSLQVHDESTEEEIELSPEDMGLIPFAGEEIDFREVVQEQVIMAMPLRPLCDEACRGLCQHCGADLNEGPCACPPTDFSIKFSALKNFKAEKK